MNNSLQQYCQELMIVLQWHKPAFNYIALLVLSSWQSQQNCLCSTSTLIHIYFIPSSLSDCSHCQSARPLHSYLVDFSACCCFCVYVLCSQLPWEQKSPQDKALTLYTSNSLYKCMTFAEVGVAALRGWGCSVKQLWRG